MNLTFGSVHTDEKKAAKFLYGLGVFISGKLQKFYPVEPNDFHEVVFGKKVVKNRFFPKFLFFEIYKIIKSLQDYSVNLRK